MKKTALLFLLAFSILSFAQKSKKMDVVSNLEMRVLGMKALGNNSLAKDLGMFYGFGFGGQLMTPKNFGLGLDYNLLFSDVKYGRENIFGNLGSQRLSMITAKLIHKDWLSEDFFLEENVGFNLYRLNSTIIPGKEKYTEGNGGYHLGLQLVYTLDREGFQQFVFGATGNGYFANVNNENKAIEKYFSRSFLVGLSFGYRYNF